eukprot:s2_g75.t1
MVKASKSLFVAVVMLHLLRLLQSQHQEPLQVRAKSLRWTQAYLLNMEAGRAKPPPAAWLAAKAAACAVVFKLRYQRLMVFLMVMEFKQFLMTINEEENEEERDRREPDPLVIIEGAAISLQLKVFVSLENETMEDLLYRVRRLALDEMGAAFPDELILRVANKPSAGTVAGAAEALKGVLPAENGLDITIAEAAVPIDLEADKDAAKNCEDIHQAAQKGNVGAVRHFLRVDPGSLERKDKDGWTPLHLAAAGGRVEVVALLLKSGASVEATTDSGGTALHRAALLGHAAVVEQLISAGAKVDPANRDGYTALHRAAGEGQDAVVGQLISAGAKVDAADKDGETPYDLAKKWGHHEVMGLLHPVFVALLSGRSCHCNSSEDRTVLELKEEAERKLAVSIKHIIGRNHEPLDESKTLAAAGVVPGNTLTAVIAASEAEKEESTGETEAEPLDEAQGLKDPRSFIDFLISADIRLVRLEFLLELHQDGVAMPRRQEAETMHTKSGATALVTLEEYQRLLVNDTTGHISIRADPDHQMVTVHFRSLSHMWESKQHPDPWGYQVGVVAELYQNLKGKGLVWVFVDLISLYQYRRNESQDRSFRKALDGMHTLYSHELVQVDILENLTPETMKVDGTIFVYDPTDDCMKWVSISSLEYNTAPHALRGWCQAEKEWARLRMMLCTAMGIPTPPEIFRQRMGQMKFTHRDDAEQVFQLQEKVFHEKALPYYQKLQYVVVNGIRLNGRDAIALLQSGAHDVQMESCQLQDEDAILIAGALMKDTTDRLRVLSLTGNGIGEAGRSALHKVMEQRPELKISMFKTRLSTWLLELVSSMASSSAYPVQAEAAVPIDPEADKAAAKYCTDIRQAAEEGNVGAVRHFLSADPESLERKEKDFGRTPLNSAAAYGRPKVVALLLRSGASVEATTDSGKTALHVAAAGGHAAVVEQLISAGAKVDAVDHQGLTALHYAANNGQAAVIEQLISAGATVDAADGNGRTPYDLAKSQGERQVMGLLHPELVSSMTSSSAHPVQAEAAVPIDPEADKAAAKDCEDIHQAAKEGNVGAVRHFLSADPESLERKGGGIYGEMPLHVAAGSGHVEVVALLLKSGASLETTDRRGFTALRVAAFHGHAAAVEQLISAGATVDAADSGGSTALHYAARLGRAAVAEQLISAGATVDAVDGNGKTPYDVAEQRGKRQVVGLLHPVFVALLSGRSCRCDSSEDRTVLELKEEAEKKLGVNIKHIIGQNHEPLDDSKTLAAADVVPGNTLTAVIAASEAENEEGTGETEAKPLDEAQGLKDPRSFIDFLISADIRLVRLEFLLELHQDGLAMPRRQEAETMRTKRGKTALVTLEEYQRLLVNDTTGHVSIRAGSRHQTVHFRSLSHMWESMQHPDPWRYQLGVVAELYQNLPDVVWVFVDFISLHQYKRSEPQDRSFRKALDRMHMLYSHEMVQVDILEDLTPEKMKVDGTVDIYDPTDDSMKSVPITSLILNSTPHALRGWCQAEKEWARLRMMLCTAMGIPTRPEIFRQRMGKMKFTHRDDAEQVFQLQAKVFHEKVSGTTHLHLEQLSQQDLEALHEALPYYQKLQYVVVNGVKLHGRDAVALLQSGAHDVQMESCQLQDEDAILIAEALMEKTTDPLRVLRLTGNGIGEKGRSALHKVKRPELKISM